MTDATYPIETRTHTTKDGLEIFLIPKVGCELCVGSEDNRQLCHSLPPCGHNDGWVDTDRYIQWLAEERMT